MSNAVSSLMPGFVGQGSTGIVDCLNNMDQTVIYGKPQENPAIKGKMEHSLYMQGMDPYTHHGVLLCGLGWVSP